MRLCKAQVAMVHMRFFLVPKHFTSPHFVRYLMSNHHAVHLKLIYHSVSTLIEKIHFASPHS